MNADARETMLRLLTEDGAAGSVTHQEALAQLAQNDPRLALLTSLLAQRENTPVEREPDDDEAELADAVELAQLREISITLAGALGACERCWGADPACRTCRGDGGPGAFAPDEELFREIVAPAARRLRQRRPDVAGSGITTGRSEG
jgi:hypothetical protein